MASPPINRQRLHARRPRAAETSEGDKKWPTLENVRDLFGRSRYIPEQLVREEAAMRLFGCRPPQNGEQSFT